MPEAFDLLPNYPNPFNPTTTLVYTLPVQAEVRLTVYDLFGKVVRVLVDRPQAPGLHEVRFDAQGLASGTYFYHIQASTFSRARQMILLK